MQRQHSKEIEAMLLTLEDTMSEIYWEKDTLLCTIKILKFYSLFEAFTREVLKELLHKQK